jgi:hypothetical protein
MTSSKFMASLAALLASAALVWPFVFIVLLAYKVIAHQSDVQFKEYFMSGLLDGSIFFTIFIDIVAAIWWLVTYLPLGLFMRTTSWFWRKIQRLFSQP